LWTSNDLVPEDSQKSGADGKAFQLSERSSKQDLDNGSISTSSAEDGEERGCCVWLSIPPEGYVALGCVVWKGQKEPPKSAALCVLAALVSPCSMRDCINIKGHHR
jgi:vacuolar protein sorting-associated protein 13A/C